MNPFPRYLAWTFLVAVFTPITTFGQFRASLGTPVVVPAQEDTLPPAPAPLPVPVTPSGPPTILVAPATYTVNDLVQIGLDQNPALKQAALEIEAARGLAVQAGLYPNPMVSVSGEELGPQGGIITAPMVSQEIVTAGKKRLDRAIGERKADQATLTLAVQRYELMTTIRQAFFEALLLQERINVLENLEKIAAGSYDLTKRLVEVSKTASTLDLLQVQVELNRVQVELATTRKEYEGAWRRLAAFTGSPVLPQLPLAGKLDEPLPNFDFDQVRAVVIEHHPSVGLARVGISVAELSLKRQKVEPIPNVTVGAGYQRNNDERANQWTFQVGMPIPVFNRNQGNIFAAQADLGKAAFQVPRVQNELTSRLAVAFASYQAAQERATRYRKTILPAATLANKIALDAYKGGAFEYLRVLQSQRTLQEANLEYLRALGDAWRSASEIAGLILAEEIRFGTVTEKK